MKIKALCAMSLSLLLMPMLAQADKPDWAGTERAGEERPGAGRMEPRPEPEEKTVMEDDEDESERFHDGSQGSRMDEQQTRNREEAMTKQREKKMAREQKELERGSEEGQAARENRKKWWRFWD